MSVPPFAEQFGELDRHSMKGNGVPVEVKREAWLRVADACKPNLTKVRRGGARILMLPPGWQGWHPDHSARSRDLKSTIGSAAPQLILDFGQNLVGRLILKMRGTSSSETRQVTVRFGEILPEVCSQTSEHAGQLPANWLEPVEMDLRSGDETVYGERRAFRFVKIEPAIDLEDAAVEAEDSLSEVLPTDQSNWPQWLREVYGVALQTLRNCAQAVFEDGPKRDQRLWLGDLRLQAISSYAAAPCYDLIKRCLYLLAACADDRGMIFACVFEKPEWHRNDEWIPDYGLLFGAVLLDYALASGDLETAAELWPIARQQVEMLDWFVGDSGVYECKPGVWNFVDWNADLDRSTPLQGIAMYGLGQLSKLASLLNRTDETAALNDRYQRMKTATMDALFDNELGLFVSGPNRQVSWASQIWMILGGAVDGETGQSLLRRVIMQSEAVAPVTPYLYHHLVEAQLLCGLADEALKTIHDYWGEMVRRGATTFWEVFVPGEPTASPYGNFLHNSYCHAWSCTPLSLAPKAFALTCASR